MGATTYQQSQLEALWVQAGGSPAAAPMASAIALAESGGNPGAHSSTDDWGLWQIHNGGPTLLDPLANAQRAVSLSSNGTNWRPWCTAYSDAACGTKGGTYLGSGSPFLRYLTGANGAVATGAGQATTIPSAVTNAPTDTDCLVKVPIPIPGVNDICIHRSQGRALAGGAAIVGGGLVLLMGLVILATGAAPKVALKRVQSSASSAPTAPASATPAQEPLTEEEAEQKRLYDEELAERRRTRVARREGLVKEVA